MVLTAQGQLVLLQIGITPEDLTPCKRPVCRHCLDRSERRHHLAGLLGSLLLLRFTALAVGCRPAINHNDIISQGTSC